MSTSTTGAPCHPFGDATTYTARAKCALGLAEEVSLTVMETEWLYELRKDVHKSLRNAGLSFDLDHATINTVSCNVLRAICLIRRRQESQALHAYDTVTNSQAPLKSLSSVIPLAIKIVGPGSLGSDAKKHLVFSPSHWGTIIPFVDRNQSHSVTKHDVIHETYFEEGELSQKPNSVCTRVPVCLGVLNPHHDQKGSRKYEFPHDVLYLRDSDGCVSCDVKEHAIEIVGDVADVVESDKRGIQMKSQQRYAQPEDIILCTQGALVLGSCKNNARYFPWIEISQAFIVGPEFDSATRRIDTRGQPNFYHPRAGFALNPAIVHVSQIEIHSAALAQKRGIDVFGAITALSDVMVIKGTSFFFVEVSSNASMHTQPTDSTTSACIIWKGLPIHTHSQLRVGDTYVFTALKETVLFKDRPYLSRLLLRPSHATQVHPCPVRGPLRDEDASSSRSTAGTAVMLPAVDGVGNYRSSARIQQGLATLFARPY